jgi:hypothetical protein
MACKQARPLEPQACSEKLVAHLYKLFRSATEEQTMSRWADWFPISPEEAKAFIAASKRGDEAVQELLQPWLERLEDLPFMLIWTRSRNRFTGT